MEDVSISPLQEDIDKDDTRYKCLLPEKFCKKHSFVSATSFSLYLYSHFTEKLDWLKMDDQYDDEDDENLVNEGNTEIGLKKE